MMRQIVNNTSVYLYMDLMKDYENKDANKLANVNIAKYKTIKINNIDNKIKNLFNLEKRYYEH